MKKFTLIFCLILGFTILQCTKDDQIRVETDITTLPDHTDVTFLIQIVDGDGHPLPDAVLTNTLNSSIFVADQQGLIRLPDLSIPAGGLPVTVELEGWMKRVKVLRGQSNSQSVIRLEMYRFDSETIIATGSTGVISNNGQLSLPYSLKQEDNSLYSGPVRVKSHYYDPSEPNFLAYAPGDMSAIGNEGELFTLQSFGMYAIELFDEMGMKLSIPEGETALLAFPIPGNLGAIPDEIPLWSMDENSGKWVEEGVAAKKGNFIEAEVAHFSWWNLDIPFDPTEICMTLVDQQGIPLSGFTFLISSPNQQLAYFYGEADLDGNFCAQIPIGLPVAISVWLETELSPAVELGTFNTPTPTNLGTIAFELTVIHVNGKAVDCEGLPLDNALVWYTHQEETNYTFSQDDGSFNFVLLTEGDLEIQVLDQQNLVQSEISSLYVTSDPGSYDLGDMSTCENLDNGQPLVVVGNISSDVTWTADRTYILSGHVNVIDGATLTIEPGTLIKSQVGSGPNASVLFIARGSTIIAEGTADAPIIFTSILDEITQADIAAGNFASPNLTANDQALWGGLVLLGYARVSALSTSENQIEGILANDPNYYYGGNDDTDNSGILKYISIRHGGVNIGLGNEINALTLAGVGSGTEIAHIEIVGCNDDGIEWFGGSVNVTNAVVWNVGDDAIDTDQSWGGILDNFVVLTPGGSCFELDGAEAAYEARHTIQNGTVVAASNGYTLTGALIDVDNITLVDMRSIHFVAPLEGLTMTEDEVQNSTFENVTFAVNPADLPALMEQGGAVPAGISAGGVPMANAAVFSWTWTAQAGQLDGL